jgi:general secretion pathway protein D
VAGWILVVGLLLNWLAVTSRAAELPSTAPTNEVPAAPAKTNPGPAQASPETTAPAPAPDSASIPVPSVITINGTNFIRLNFRGARLDLVLDYLSDAAGFIINKETDIRGTIDAWSKEPVTKDEAVELLNTNLKKNGYAVVRNNRILTIVSLENAKTSDLPVEIGSDPEGMDGSDEVVTQLIPVKYANATQLMNNLQVLLPTSASLSVNESANTLLMVATKRDIRRMLKIVHALDSSIASVCAIKVIQLKFADAKQLATEITALFAPQSSNQGGGGFRNQMFNMFRGGGPGGFGLPGGIGGPGGGGSGGGNSGGAANAKVTATSDDYSNCLIVSAPSDLMNTITDMVQQIDVETTDVTVLRYFKLHHADPVELADQFATLFPDTTRTDTSQGFGGGFRFGGPFGFGRNNQATSSDRSKKRSQVVAVADPRTSSLIVSAASELMPHIEALIAQMDEQEGRKEVVTFYELKNADPQDVYTVLDDLFHRTGQVRSTGGNNQKSMLGTSNPLTTRETQSQSTILNNSGFNFGNSTGSRGTGGF